MNNQRDDSRDFMTTNSGVNRVFANPQLESDDGWLFERKEYNFQEMAYPVPGPWWFESIRHLGNLMSEDRIKYMLKREVDDLFAFGLRDYFNKGIKYEGDLKAKLKVFTEPSPKHLDGYDLPGPGDEPLTEIDLSGWMPFKNECKARFIDTWNLGR